MARNVKKINKNSRNGLGTAPVDRPSPPTKAWILCICSWLSHTRTWTYTKLLYQHFSGAGMPFCLSSKKLSRINREKKKLLNQTELRTCSPQKGVWCLSRLVTPFKSFISPLILWCSSEVKTKSRPPLRCKHMYYSSMYVYNVGCKLHRVQTYTLVNIEMTTSYCTIVRHRIIILRPCFYLLVSGFGGKKWQELKPSVFFKKEVCQVLFHCTEKKNTISVIDGSDVKIFVTTVAQNEKNTQDCFVTFVISRGHFCFLFKRMHSTP